MTRMLTPIKVDPRTLLEFLETLSKRTEKAKGWVKEHQGPFTIAVPEHLSHTVGPRDSRCLVKFAPVDEGDDQAIVEVLWLVQEAMEAEPREPARPETVKPRSPKRR
jgi:hypothetical protein